ncbi:hypothetical protein AMTR_s00100p00134720 [Amborella trichopoda]|uniref:Uncharacterized protein n=1 Tax=Amborella trichopoda TaxID=13333 RepID=W1NT49_AMBTC|nr:hypothetical protein AMTR_s00100p00134720 [Amborella trichopoda]
MIQDENDGERRRNEVLSGPAITSRATGSLPWMSHVPIQPKRRQVSVAIRMSRSVQTSRLMPGAS